MPPLICTGASTRPPPAQPPTGSSRDVGQVMPRLLLRCIPVSAVESREPQQSSPAAATSVGHPPCPARPPRPRLPSLEPQLSGFRLPAVVVSCAIRQPNLHQLRTALTEVSPGPVVISPPAHTCPVSYSSLGLLRHVSYCMPPETSCLTASDIVAGSLQGG